MRRWRRFLTSFLKRCRASSPRCTASTAWHFRSSYRQPEQRLMQITKQCLTWSFWERWSRHTCRRAVALSLWERRHLMLILLFVHLHSSSNPQRVPCLRNKCTACNRLHHFADVCESRHNPLPTQSQDTVSPHTADVDTCSLAPVDDPVAVHQDARRSNQLHVRHIVTHHRHTIVKPDRSGKPLPPLTLHSEVRIQDPHTKSWDQCGTIVRIGARRAYRVQLPSGRGCWRKRRSLRPLPNFSEPPQRCRQWHSFLFLSLSHFFLFQTS